MALRVVVAMLALLGGLGAAPALAQIRDIVPDELLNRFRATGNQIRFCLNSASALVDFDRAVATRLAESSLLEAKFYELVYPSVPYPYEYGLTLPEKELFIQVTNNCDVVIGYPLPEGDVLPPWLTTTQPYYRPGYVFALSPDTPSLASLPAGAEIGSRMAVSADIYVRAFFRKSDNGLRRRVYPLNTMIVSDLLSGKIGAAVLWAPAVTLAAKANPAAAAIRTEPLPFPVPPVELAIAIPTNNLYLREVLDPAIGELRSSGEFARLLDEHSLPPE